MSEDAVADVDGERGTRAAAGQEPPPGRAVRIPSFNFTIPLEDRLRAAEGIPAFVRRARRVELAMEDFETRIAEFHRRESAPVVKALAALAGELRAVGRDGASGRRARRALESLRGRVRRYNKKRDDFLRSFDLTPLNAQIEGYRRYYMIEREAWCRYTAGTGGAKPWRPLTRRDLETRLPPLGWP